MGSWILYVPFADNVQQAQLDSEATTRYLSEMGRNIGELELKVRLLADDSIVVVGLKKQLAAGIPRIAILGESSANLNNCLMFMTRSYAALRMELDFAPTTIARGERVIQNFADSVCKGCSLLVCAHATSHRDDLNVVLTDAQQASEYLGEFRVSVSENGHSLHVGNANNDEERGDRAQPSGADSDDVEVVPPTAWSS